ncbi:haloacid dehalogenase-like hydrolase, partial [Streptomyces sp. NPDC059697]|uniref:haloacid dehalogenase-like hydrolase n=1 Tax=Streptomyces sp. NPDC059697 TaxID=3346912 RepID=UPI003685528A
SRPPRAPPPPPRAGGGGGGGGGRRGARGWCGGGRPAPGPRPRPRRPAPPPAAEVVCARPAAHCGRFTGELLGPPMIGTAKREAVRAVLDRYPQVAVADCYGYGDHVTDLPMLTEVGHPVVVGGSPELLRLLPRRCRVSRLLCPEHERELVVGQLPGMVLYG